MTNEEIDIINSMRWVVQRSIRLKKTIDVRDVMQDLFVKILSNYKKFSKLNEKEKCGYAYTACINLLRDMNRRRNAKNCNHCTDIFLFNGEMENYKSLQNIETIYDKIELKEVLKKMKKHPLHHELLLYSQGHSIREIEKLRSKNQNTVGARIRYTRAYLKKNFNHGKN